MSEPEGSQGRPARGRAQVWRPWAPWAASGARPSWAWPDGLAKLARRIAHRTREWLLVEVGAGRLVPWLAIGFGAGILLYFSVDQEPAPWAAIVLFVATAATSISLRLRPVGFPLALFAAAIAFGFATATIKRALIAHPVLWAPAWNVEIAGFVEMREERERSDRITLRVERIAGPRLNERLDRVRVSVRKGTAPAVGEFVEFRARLSPPLEPLRPGGYDFARDMYFQRIGASGFVLGRIRSVEPPHARSVGLRYAMTIDGMRDAIDKRIRAVLPGDGGSIASALITGKRDAISPQVNEAMYVSGLAHVLSISGYHMAVVAGLIFFVMRALFALLGAFANRHPIKKWAALAALAAAAFYLALSGAEVATQRSFIMIAIVLIGVLVDRQTLTFRTITVAAFGVLMLAPEAVVHPSFQMSFAATLALIAGYQHGLPWMSRGGDTALAARIALWGGREAVGLTLVSLLAGTATIPYIAYHFHRISPFGVVANLIAMPVVSAWVMPWGILGLVAMPLGLDHTCWWLMGLGIDWMTAVALWVTTFPGALGRMTAFDGIALLICTLGLVVLCLLRTPLRLIGGILIGGAVLMMVRSPQPDIVVAPDASAVGIRGGDGRLAMVHSGSDVFALREWLAADGDARGPKDSTLAKGISCDEAGCIGRLRDGALVAVVKRADAFEEDCRRAVLVISARAMPPDCETLIIDRAGLRPAAAGSWGAVALRRVDGRFEITTTRPIGYDRPWARNGARNPSPLTGGLEAGSLRTPQSRDATPRPDDLEPGD
jgi:competence protein ComEC